ncbi:MAG: hypothetical protein ABIH82_06035 [Candidatus Woesearchaeota archaeon]
MNKPTPIGEEKIVFKGLMFEVVNQLFREGDREVTYKKVRRAPGTRLIIIKDKKILLTKEYRTELNGFDYRLPGGKVFDSLDEYNLALKENDDILVHAIKGAKKECLEETGLVPITINHFHTTSPGAMVQWDLFYFIIDNFENHQDGQQTEDSEIIEPLWRTYREVKQMCVNGEIKEDRTVGVLLRFILQNE